MKPNPVVWFEIYVQDLSRARNFYEQVFQCRLEPLVSPEGEASGFEMLAFPGDMTATGAGGALGAEMADALCQGIAAGRAAIEAARETRSET